MAENSLNAGVLAAGVAAVHATWTSKRERSRWRMISAWIKVSAPNRSGELTNRTPVFCTAAVATAHSLGNESDHSAAQVVHEPLAGARRQSHRGQHGSLLGPRCK